SPVYDWDMYTFGYGLVGPYAADTWATLFSSSNTSASGPCAGATDAGGTPNNPTFVCNPMLDGMLAQQGHTTDPLAYECFALVAMNYYGQMAGDLSVYSPAIRLAALTSVGGLVNAKGFSYNNPYTLLNAQPSTGYNPVCQGTVTSSCPSGMDYRFGGGDPTTLRYGQADPTTQLSVFNAQTNWEFQLISEIYDTLYNANPVAPTTSFCLMCDSATQSLVNGNTVFHLQLRQNLHWHDGQTVDNKDVCFSLLALRDFAAYNQYGLQGVLLSCKPATASTPQMDITLLGRNIQFPKLLYSSIE